MAFVQLEEKISSAVSAATGKEFKASIGPSVGGGCVSDTRVILSKDSDSLKFFAKIGTPSEVSMLAAEYYGVLEMYNTETIRLPKPICYDSTDRFSFLILENLNMTSRAGRREYQLLGKQLARLHRCTSDRGFGWHRGNTIGPTPQLNPWTSSWTEFFVNYRLHYQMELAKRNNLKFEHEEGLLHKVEKLLNQKQDVIPSLVHGDLWSGNIGFLTSGEPVIFDPATYYGDREVDIAMTELFGRLPEDFYVAYNDEFPLTEGYEQRRIVYNLYHVLNHFNLFGGMYGRKAKGMMQEIMEFI
ncbi:hypothetical protein GpartN1_g535.t1 [Galdieria partita]|uniref:protein-ribulosamine 3-kinase n=1 Tax=Galdieria partita TaxID=83374 RepID=A0A9C7PQV2_9RHOD|nr:hypothetical protein GpartN1_g535.t1 [Galdieria partita]